jgi:hypothetical protein
LQAKTEGAEATIAKKADAANVAVRITVEDAERKVAEIFDEARRKTSALEAEYNALQEPQREDT